METSEQQRRSTIGQFAESLKSSNLEFDAGDLIDILWLAQFIEPGVVLSDDIGETPGENTKLKVETIEADDTSISETTLNLYPEDISKSDTPLDSEGDSEEGTALPQKGISFPVPAASALRIRLDLARSLRPLMRKVPSRSRFDVDEDATVTQIAETRVWMPVVMPMPERWLDLDLVVEASKTTVIWERAIAELQHLMEYQGAFRTVRTWSLSAHGQEIKLFPRWHESSVDTPTASHRPRSPRELVDPTGRRLVLFVTDCTSALWRRGRIHETLWQWSVTQPVALLQLLPERLWVRTALSDGHIVRLGSLSPGQPSAHLTIDGLPSLISEDEIDERAEPDVLPEHQLEEVSDSRLLALPVVTLDPQAIFRWAKVVAGVGDIRTPGRIFELEFVEQLSSSRSAQPSVSRTAQQRVALFRSTASKTAQQLANLMAATPVSLPVIDLLREEFRHEFQDEVRQSHVAEVLLSGLLRRCDNEASDKCRYEFFGDNSPNKDEHVREVLLGDASISRTVAVLNKLSEAIAQKAGRELKSFEALLADLQSTNEEWHESAWPFAKIGLDVLRRLGGEYAEIANRYDLKRLPKSAGLEVGAGDFEIPPLREIDFMVGHVVDADDEAEQQAEWLPLQTDTFQIATITLVTEDAEAGDIELADVGFQIAKIVRQKQDAESDDQWVIQKQNGSATQFLEEFVDTYNTLSSLELDKQLGRQTSISIQGIEMVYVAGDTFLMGSPDDEPERSSWEGPQHEVTVQSFFMGKYPITQAQWRFVAELEQVNRELDSDPSNFKGDDRPVEKVSWYEAVEFCDRLSRHTGKDYRLPTEAEWEYACRAGTTTPFHFGETISSELANYRGNSTYNGGPKGENRGETTLINHFKGANAFGLHDMHGNVSEWCQDHWHDNYKGAPTDGSAWLTDNEGSSRVRRGGSWFSHPRNCRSAYRLNTYPDARFNNLGFRVVCSAPRTLQPPTH